MPRFTANQNTLYLCDNGRCVCGDHLGTTAKMTGRDLSGQRVYAIRPTDHKIGTTPFKCETCNAILGRTAKAGALRAVLVRPKANGSSDVQSYGSI